MWFLREIVRLLMRIGVAVLIALVIAEVRAATSGGDSAHTFQVVIMCLGVIFLLLAGTGKGSAASRRVNWGSTTGAGGVIFRSWQPRPEDPTLTPTAVFIGSGIACLAIGIFI